MKRALILFGLWLLPLVLVLPASAQEAPIGCEQLQNEEININELDINLDEICNEESPGRELEKGEPNPETVAGTEEEIVPPPVVLGDSIDNTAVLAETGVSALLAIPAGMFIIAISLAISRLAKEKYKINK